MSDMFVLQVTFVRCPDVNNMIRKSREVIKACVARGNVQLRELYKVVGENRIVSVLDGDVDDVVRDLNDVGGQYIEVSCSPVRNLSEFAKNILGVDTVADPNDTPLPVSGSQIFWCELDLEYKDKTLDAFHAIWKAEATHTFGGGTFNKAIHTYKVICEARIVVIISAPSGSLFDDMSTKLPFYIKMGNQINVNVKRVTSLV